MTHSISLRIETTDDAQWHQAWAEINDVVERLGGGGFPSISVSCCPLPDELEEKDE